MFLWVNMRVVSHLVIVYHTAMNTPIHTFESLVFILLSICCYVLHKDILVNVRLHMP